MISYFVYKLRKDLLYELANSNNLKKRITIFVRRCFWLQMGLIETYHFIKSIQYAYLKLAKVS